jgi:cob(I)alamin adenosyltransferase
VQHARFLYLTQTDGDSSGNEFASHLSFRYNINMSKFYTKNGDDGYTGLLGEGRIAKHSPRLETVGALDEATAALGVARAICTTPGIAQLILTIQRDLYQLMAEVSATPENAARFRKITSDQVSWLEEQTDGISNYVPLPDEFIVPGDSTGGAALSVARTVVRRAERWIAKLIHTRELENCELLRYINRLSSLCFILELLENQAAGNSSPTIAKQPDQTSKY